MTHAVAIIGGAPSGTAGLERLTAQLHATSSDEPVEIHIFNRTPRFGPGDVYDANQLDCLSINVSAADFNIWSTQTPALKAGSGRPLSDWCQQDCEPAVPVAAADHPSRALAGRYLAAAFEAMASNLPAGVTLHRHIGDVIDVVPSVAGYEVIYRPAHPAGSELAVECHHLLLATGHTRRRFDRQEVAFAKFAARHPRCAFIASVYPVTEMLEGVATGSTVAIKGMSLTFVDAVLALTQGLGGRFERNESGRLGYLPSGREPARILPFSRSGLPARPRSSDITRYQHEPVFFHQRALAALRQASPDGRIEFARDGLPLFKREMEWAYYSVAMAGSDYGRRLLACGGDHEAVRRLIDAFLRLHFHIKPFNAEQLLNPTDGRMFASGASFQEYVLQHLRRENERAHRGAAKDAEKAAVEMWRFCRLEFLPFAAFAGFTPNSHRKLHQEIWPRMQQLVFGPPVENMEKIVALTESGLLDFSVALSPEVRFCDQSAAFKLHCRRTATEATAEVLVDARVSTFHLSHDESTLYRNLHHRGLVRAFENTHTEEPPFRPGALDVAADGYSVIGKDGLINPYIAVVGAPTLGCHYENPSPLVGEGGGATEKWAQALVASLGDKNA